MNLMSKVIVNKKNIKDMTIKKINIGSIWIKC